MFDSQETGNANRLGNKTVRKNNKTAKKNETATTPVHISQPHFIQVIYLYTYCEYLGKCKQTNITSLT